MNITTNYTASNSDVRKRFTMSQIMTRAWQVIRNQGIAFIPTFESFGAALKWVWAEFRDILTKRLAVSRKRAEWLVKQPVKAPVMRKGHRSPLNPNNPSRYPQWGVFGNEASAVSMASR